MREGYKLNFTGARINELLSTLDTQHGDWESTTTSFLDLELHGQPVSTTTSGVSPQTYHGVNLYRLNKAFEDNFETEVPTCGSNAKMAINLAFPNYMDPDFEYGSDTPAAPQINGYGAVVLGGGKALGKYCLAIGGGNSTLDSDTNTYSSKVPVTATATGKYSMAIGTHVLASNDTSTAIGAVVFTEAPYSFAQGHYTCVFGTNATAAFAQGEHVTALGKYQFVHGCANYPLESGYAEVVGWGDKSTAKLDDNTGRKNIYTLSTDGNLHVSGSIYMNDSSTACTNSGYLVATQAFVTDQLENYSTATNITNGSGEFSLKMVYPSSPNYTSATSAVAGGSNCRAQGNQSLAFGLYNATNAGQAIALGAYNHVQALSYAALGIGGRGVGLIVGTTTSSLGNATKYDAKKTYTTKGTLVYTEKENIRSYFAKCTDESLKNVDPSTMSTQTFTDGNWERVNYIFGQSSVKEGYGTTIGHFAHAMGIATVANHKQLVLGQYNKLLTYDYLFIVGNGDGTGESRKNICTLNSQGDLTLSGDLFVKATNAACTTDSGYRVPKIYSAINTSTVPSDAEYGDFGFTNDFKYIWVVTRNDLGNKGWYRIDV